MSVLLQEQFLNAMHESWDECDERYSLVGQDGNAFALMGYTARCMKECGLRDEIKEMQNKAMSGDYNHLIYVCNEYVQRCNDIACGLDESCGKKKLVTESMEEIDRQLFTSLNKEGDGHYYILNDGNYVKDFYANSDEEAKNKFKIWIEKKNVNEACDDKKVDEHLISERDWDERTDDVADDYHSGKITKVEYDKKIARLDKMLDEEVDLDESVWDLLKDKLAPQNDDLAEGFDPKMWQSMSGVDQYAAETAIDLIKQGAPLEDAVQEGVHMTNCGNAEPEYEDDGFYEDEADYSKVFDFVSKYLED